MPFIEDSSLMKSASPLPCQLGGVYLSPDPQTSATVEIVAEALRWDDMCKRFGRPSWDVEEASEFTASGFWGL